MNKKALDLRPFFKKDRINIREAFPYQAYVASSNKSDITQILKDLAILDSVFPSDKQTNQEVLSITLTSKLEETTKPVFQNCAIDSLIYIVQWAEKFKAYSEIDKEHEMLFQVVYNHWMNFAANQMAECYQKDGDIKHDSRFKYIRSRCNENSFNIPIGNSKAEKIVENMIEGKWGYILNRFWIGTSLILKSSILLFLSITLYAYWCMFRFHFRKNKS